jgi:excisionase family DNA binding protein
MQPDLLQGHTTVLLGALSLTVIYELAAQDKLPIPSHRVGRQYRLSRRAYDAWLERQHEDANG